MIDMLTFHGSYDSERHDMNDWGFNGPTIKDIEAIHSTYGNEVIYFTSSEAAEIAHRETGWEFWDAHALEPQFEDGLLVLKPTDGSPTMYFGDWEYQFRSPVQARLEKLQAKSGLTGSQIDALKDAKQVIDRLCKEVMS